MINQHKTHFGCPSLGAIAGLGILWATVGTPETAQALIITQDGTDYVEIEPVLPDAAGVYGLEARGGRDGRRDWEIGVGERTSVPGHFNQTYRDWGVKENDPLAAEKNLTNFSMSWMPGEGLVVNIGQTVTQWLDDDWLVGNTIKIFAKRAGILKVAEIDGQAVDYTFGTVDADSSETWYISDHSLLDGWTMSGQIGVAQDRGSKHEVLIKVGNKPLPPTQEVPTPAALLPGLLSLGAGLRRKLRATPDS